MIKLLTIRRSASMQGNKISPLGKILTTFLQSVSECLLMKMFARFRMGKCLFPKQSTIVHSAQNAVDFSVNKFSDHAKILNVRVENTNESATKAWFVNDVAWK